MGIPKETEYKIEDVNECRTNLIDEYKTEESLGTKTFAKLIRNSSILNYVSSLTTKNDRI